MRTKALATDELAAAESFSKSSQARSEHCSLLLTDQQARINFLQLDASLTLHPHAFGISIGIWEKYNKIHYYYIMMLIQSGDKTAKFKLPLT